MLNPLGRASTISGGAQNGWNAWLIAGRIESKRNHSEASIIRNGYTNLELEFKFTTHRRELLRGNQARIDTLEQEILK